LVFAGLWDLWEGPSGSIETVTILTVVANELIAPLHDRMTAVLMKEQFDLGLNPKLKPAALLSRLAPPREWRSGPSARSELCGLNS